MRPHESVCSSVGVAANVAPGGTLRAGLTNPFPDAICLPAAFPLTETNSLP